MAWQICLFLKNCREVAKKTRHRFEDSCNMNALNWKFFQKINSIRTWLKELAKGRIFKWNYVLFAAKIWIRQLFISNSKIFMYLLWPCRVLVLIFFAKTTRGSCVSCFSSVISFNPTSHLKWCIRWRYWSHQIWYL